MIIFKVQLPKNKPAPDSLLLPGENKAATAAGEQAWEDLELQLRAWGVPPFLS